MTRGFLRSRSRAHNRVADQWLDGTPDVADLMPYSPNFGDDIRFDRAGLIIEFIKSAAYKEGAVIWTEVNGRPRLARIVGLNAERSHLGDRRLVLFVQTQVGDRWSLVKRRTYPGFVQRAYAAQGDATAIAERGE